MKITALVENRAGGDLKAKHGLALYIETVRHKILFDVGPDGVLFENAARRRIDLTAVDTVVLSHGHTDHGGALGRFLESNANARVYAQRRAFLPHFGKLLFCKVGIGIDPRLANHPRMVLLDGDFEIDGELFLFTAGGNKCHSPANEGLYEGKERDGFGHEQSLIIREKETALIMGCGHAGVVNIMEKAAAHGPSLCVGGFHLNNPLGGKAVPETLLDDIAEELKKYPGVEFYTCHCTGQAAFAYLSAKLPNLRYLSCGEEIER